MPNLIKPFSFLFLFILALTTNANITALRSLNNNPTQLKNYIDEHQHVRLKTRNGAWTKNIILPNDVDEGKKVTVEVNSSWSVMVNDGNLIHTLNTGNKQQWIYANNTWFVDNFAINTNTNIRMIGDIGALGNES